MGGREGWREGGRDRGIYMERSFISCSWEHLCFTDIKRKKDFGSKLCSFSFLLSHSVPAVTGGASATVWKVCGVGERIWA